MPVAGGARADRDSDSRAARGDSDSGPGATTYGHDTDADAHAHAATDAHGDSASAADLHLSLDDDRFHVRRERNVDVGHLGFVQQHELYERAENENAHVYDGHGHRDAQRLVRAR